MEELVFLANPSFSPERISILCEFFARGYTTKDVKNSAFTLLSDKELNQKLIQLRKSRVKKEHQEKLNNMIQKAERKDKGMRNCAPKKYADMVR